MLLNNYSIHYSIIYQNANNKSYGLQQTSSEPNSLLHEFLDIFERLPSDIINASLKASNDEDSKAVTNAFAPSFTEQFKQLSLHLREISQGASKQQHAEAEKFLRMSSGINLANNLKLSLPSIGSIIGKLGIDGIIKEIKKIITKLLELFHINLPDWVHDIVNLIDEILADILGEGSIKTKTALSHAEQNYLAELTQLAKLKKATKDLRIDEDDL